MLGSSRTSLALVNEAVAGAFHDDGLGIAGDDLLAITDLLTREKPLLAALADGGREGAERSGVLSRLVGEQVSPLGLSLATTVVGNRWSSEGDLVDALEQTGASALIGAAEKDGTADRVADELFRFGRIVDANGELQLTLSSPQIPAQAKRAVVAELLAEKADPTTVQLASFAVTHLRGRKIEDAIDGLVELAAVRRGELSAVVRVASPLDADQEQRLGAALETLYGRPVQLSIEIDPALIGGVSVQVGDEVIDGTLANKIAQARRRLAG